MIRISIRQTNRFLFVLYNMVYVLYRVNMLNRWIYMGTLGAFFAFEIFVVMCHKKTESMVFQTEFRMTMLVAALFFVISLGIQFYHGNFQTYLFEELLYFIVPCLAGYVCVNYCQEEDIKWFFYIILLKLTLYFFLRFWRTFSISAILAINFFDSSSSLYEVEIAHDFFFLMVIFVYFDDWKAVLLSFVLCILSFKRLPFLLAFMVLFFYLLGKSGKVLRLKEFSYQVTKWLEGNFSRGTLFLIFLIMLFLPFIMKWLYSDQGVQWMYDQFAMDLRKFTSGRSSIVNYALLYCQPNGLGSITDFFVTNESEVYRRVANMHCDVIRLKEEVTMLGYMVYSYVLIRVFRQSRLLMSMLLYLVLEMTISHMIGNLNIWIMLYIFAAYLQKKRQYDMDAL